MMAEKPQAAQEEAVRRVQDGGGAEWECRFQEQLQALCRQEWRTITLDLSELRALSGACIGKMLLCGRQLARQGRTLRIRGCSDPLWHTFQLIRLDRAIPLEKQAGS